MKPSKERRIVYWNTRAEHPPEEIHTWYFLIVNEGKITDRIVQRVFEQLQPVDNLTEYRDETLRGRDVRVRCLSFTSSKIQIDFNKAYRGKWKRAQELYVRSGLDNLIDRMSGKI